ncbi:MAG: hypothetical protein LBU26_06960, partial [Synergistaceae bacterium]|nr:hypothetical protein [Synergistaceae bacterium]
ELFTALSKVLTDYQIVHQNLTSTAGVQPGANFTLQITFNGEYYKVMKALAAIRESGYIMRISELRLNAEGNGNVYGTMNIVSTSQAQS